MKRVIAGLFSLGVLCACGRSSAVTGSGSAADEATSSKLLGNPDGSDSADRSCNVILRSAGVNQNRGGLEANCIAGTSICWVVIHGTIDISQVGNLEGDTPFVTYLSTYDNTWHTAPTVAVDGAGTGYARFAFRLDTNTTMLNGPDQTVQLIPYLRAASRIFDHNRLPNAFDNYVLTPASIWSVADDETDCAGAWPPGDATAVFSAGFTQQLQGQLIAGGKLNVSYDLTRLPQCFNSIYNGLPAWDTLGYVQFQPGGSTLTRSVRGVQDPTTGAWSSALFSVDVPPSATSAAMWFYTSGDYCEPAWDSNYSQNYVYPVSP